jgi:tetratricopeptide (TPR) repeat protein
MAETHFRQAMAAEPVPPTVRFRYVVYYLLPLGRVADAMGQSRVGLETDPLSMILHWGMALSMNHAKPYRETIECARRALEIDPSFYLIWYGMGLAQLGAGFTQEAVASLKRVVELAPWLNVGVGSPAAAYYQAGDRERSQEWARKLTASHGHAFGAALYYAAACEVDAMFEALEGAYRHRDHFLPYIQTLLFFDPYRADPRFRALLAKINLA